MRILFLGGAGAMGSVATRDLVKRNDVARVTIADIDIRKAERLVADIGSKKLSALFIDVTDHQALVKNMKEYDVVINCVGPFYQFGTRTLKAAIEAKVNYVDIGDDPETTLEMLDLDETARDAGISCLIGMGANPGLSGILAKHGASKLDRVDEVNVYWTLSMTDWVEGGAAVDYHMYMVVDGKQPEYLDGKIVKVPPFSKTKEVDFGGEVGKCEVFYVGHPEQFTLPRSIKGVKVVTNMCAVTPPWAYKHLRDIVDLGLTSAEPVKVGGISLPCRDFLVQWDLQVYFPLVKKTMDLGTLDSGLIVEIIGEKEGQPKEIRYGAPGRMAPGTGIPVAIGAQMLGRGDIKTKGVVLPPDCIESKSFLAEYGKRYAEALEELLVREKS